MSALNLHILIFLAVCLATDASQLRGAAKLRNELAQSFSPHRQLSTQEEGLPVGVRHLMETTTSDNTFIAETVEDLSLAMVGAIPGVQHIELRTHAVLTNLAGPDPQGADGPYNGGPFAPDVKSMRGNCTQPVDEAVSELLEGAALLPLTEGQCLLVNNGNMTSEFGDWWSDNLYMRFVSQGDPRPSGGKVRVKARQNVWFTRVTFQWSGGAGDGCDECVEWPQGGLEVQGSLYAQKCTFSDFRGASVIHAAANASTTFVESLAMNNAVQEALLSGISSPAGGAVVSVERSFLYNNEAPAPLATRNWKPGNPPVFYADAALSVASNSTVESAAPLAELPVARGDMAQNPEFLSRQQEAPAIERVPLIEFPGTTFVVSELTASGTQMVDRSSPQTASQPNPTTAPDAAVSDASASTQNAKPSGSKNLSSGSIAGIAAAAMVLLLALACAAYMCVLRARAQSSSKAAEASSAKYSVHKRQLNKEKGFDRAESSDGNHTTHTHSSQAMQESLPARFIMAEQGYVLGMEGAGGADTDVEAAPHTGTTHSMVSDPKWLAEEVTVSRGGPAGAPQFSHRQHAALTTKRTALTTMGPSATLSQVSQESPPLERLMSQLEWIAAHQGGCLFQCIKLSLHSGKRLGGQGVVVFAQHAKVRSRKFAVKFFLSKKAFEVEKAAALNPALRAVMPPVALVQGDEQQLQEAVEGLPQPLCTWPLPQMIVMEKGESLEEFSQRSAPDFFTSLQIMMHVAYKLHSLHEAGWVHGDLKPGNAIWLPSSNSWTLIDFGSAARVGQPLSMPFTVKYASPEVVKSITSRDSSATVQPAADVWSFGIICYELLTQTRYYCPFAKAGAVMELLKSDRPLPSEQDLPAVQAGLGTGAFKDSVLSMLSRAPAARPTVSQLIETWSQLYPLPGSSFIGPATPSIGSTPVATPANSTSVDALRDAGTAAAAARSADDFVS